MRKVSFFDTLRNLSVHRPKGRQHPLALAEAGGVRLVPAAIARRAGTKPKPAARLRARSNGLAGNRLGPSSLYVP